MKREYSVVPFPVYGPPRFAELEGHLEQLLNMKGLEGWEYVAIEQIEVPIPGSAPLLHHFAIFSREVAS